MPENKHQKVMCIRVCTGRPVEIGPSTLLNQLDIGT